MPHLGDRAVGISHGVVDAVPTGNRGPLAEGTAVSAAMLEMLEQADDGVHYGTSVEIVA
jgi:hypothetical protein